MRVQSNNLPQTFYMSILEPLILIVIPIFGIYLSLRLLFTKPMEVKLYIPILILVFCIYAILAGLAMPRKLEIYNREIVIHYPVWKRTVNVNQVKSYSLDQGQGGHGSIRYFVTVKLSNGRKISFKNIKGGNESLLKALEKWMALKPIVDIPNEADNEIMEDSPNDRREFRTPEPLSELTEKLVQKMFPPDEQMEVRQMLINQCGNNIYAHEHKDKYELEALRFSALKVSKGDVKRLHRAIKTANEDIRDIYAESGFMGEKAAEKREKWVQSILNKT